VRAPLAALGVAAYLAVLLWLDRSVGLPGQLLLGAVTWVALVAACRPLPPLLRAQTALVVVVATCGEIVGSIGWGLYTYRLENLPSFVPPAHGLVFLGGVALARAAARRRLLLAALRWGALAAVLAWGLAGVTVLARPDAGGAAGAVVLALFLLRGRAPAVYAGVFVVVAALELYGTALGTWTWAEVAPGTPITQGNPPSGIASGYVFFDIAALAGAPHLLRLARRLRPAAAAVARAALPASSSGG
jgi:hypothetical protein